MPSRNHNYRGDNLQGRTFGGGTRPQNYENADFSGAKLQEADFTRANLREADFSGAEIGGAIFKGSNLRGAKFTNASVDIDRSLPPADFSSAEIQGTDFTDAILARSNFSYTRAGLGKIGRASILLGTLLISILSAFPTAIVTTFSIYFLRAPRRKLSFINLFLIGLYAFSFNVVLRTILINLELNSVSSFLVFSGTSMIVVVLVGAFIGVVKDGFNESISSTLAATLPLLFFLIVSLTLGQIGIGGIDKLLADRLPGLKTIIPSLGDSPNDVWFLAVLGAFIGAFFGCRFAQSAILGDKKFDWLWDAYIELAIS